MSSMPLQYGRSWLNVVVIVVVYYRCRWFVVVVVFDFAANLSMLKQINKHAMSKT